MSFTQSDLNDFEESAGFHISSARQSFEEVEIYEPAVRDCLFHIEQCIETTIKTLILAFGYQPLYDRDLLIHDIGTLIGIYTVEIDGDFIIPEFIINNHSQISSWAIEPRYNNINFNITDLAVLLEDTEKFYYDAYDYLEGF